MLQLTNTYNQHIQTLLYLNLEQCQADNRIRECLIDLVVKGTYAIHSSDTLSRNMAGTKFGGPEET